jgi:hypothetical protein
MLRKYQFPALDEGGQPIPGVYSFNILLASYDVVMKDIDFLDKINWEVVVLDEGHRIKNCKGKKNNALNNLQAKHRIILTGTPIQNTLEELWTLLRFVSPGHFEEDPEFLQTEMEELTDDIIMETKNMIHPHILRRTIAEAERTLAPKEERVVFVGLTQIQKDLIRLIKMHKIWRLKGVQTTEDESEAVNEGQAIFRVCSHPFLLPEAEEFYTKRLSRPKRPMSRIDLLLAVSVKFQWLDNVLRVLHRDSHRVLIFSQRVELLKLLDEFAGLRNFTREILLGTMTDLEKAAAIDHFSNENIFIFLISTRCGNEGINLTAADTAIIFDPDWNPQNDLQAEARCHRIGQTQKVDIIRLSTFQTYEHEIFVRAQRKLGLWLTLLGSKPVMSTPVVSPPLRPPPNVVKPGLTDLSIYELLDKTSTVVSDFSLEKLPYVAAPLDQSVNYSNGLSDDDFLQTFPVRRDSGRRRTKRSRSREFQITPEVGVEILEGLRRVGFGDWDGLGEDFPDHSDEQIRRFCVVVTVVALRCLPLGDIAYLPLLVSRLLRDERDFTYDHFLCGNKHMAFDLFTDEHDLSGEAEVARKMRSDIINAAFEFLSILEMRLVANCWSALNSAEVFKWSEIAPPYSDSDCGFFTALTSRFTFDPFNSRVQAIVNRMRSDIILAGLSEEAFQPEWWSNVEVEAVMSTLRNWTFDPANPRVFHARTAILGKTTDQVVIFAQSLIALIETHDRGALMLPDDCIWIERAPEQLQSASGWAQVKQRDCAALRSRITLLEAVRRRAVEIPAAEPTGKWGDCETRKFLDALIDFGIDAQTDLLVDERFPFKEFLTEADLKFASGQRKKRVLSKSDLPDFLFSETDLAEFVGLRIPMIVIKEEPSAKPKANRRRVEVTESSSGHSDSDSPFEGSE